MAIYKAQTSVKNYLDVASHAPKNPVKGQKWIDGTILKDWDGKNWKIIVNPQELEDSVEDAKKAGENAGKVANEAKVESGKAVDSANSAVSKANDAASEAGFAKDTANEAKQTATNAGSTAKAAKENADKAINDAVASLDKSDENEKTIIDVSKNVDTVKGELSLKVSQAEYDKLKGTVSDQGTSISQNAKNIKLKASNQDVDTINETVKNQGTEISQNSKAIKTKAEQSVVDDIDGTVESISTTVEQQAGSIKAINTKTDGNTTQIGELELSYKGLNSTVVEVSGELSESVKQLSSLEQSLDGFKTTVQNEKADKTIVTQLADQWSQTTKLVDGHTGQISNLGKDINLRVEKDDVIRQINISDESILIDGDKTHITGETTIDKGVINTAHIKDAAIGNAKIKDVAAEKLNVGTLTGMTLTSLSKTGEFRVEGQHAEFINTDTNEKTELSDNGLLVFDKKGSMRSQITRRMVNSSYFGTSNVNTYITVGDISSSTDDDAKEGSGEFRVVDYDPKMAEEKGVGDGRDDYTYLNARMNALFANVVRVNYAERKDGIVNNNLYLQPRWGYEIRLTAPGTTGGNSVYQDLRGKNLYANILQSNSATGDNHVYIRPINSGELRVTNPDNTSFRNIRANDIYIRNIVKPADGDLYIGTSGRLNITGRDLWDGNNYRPIVAGDFMIKGKGSIVQSLARVSGVQTFSMTQEDDIVSLQEVSQGILNAMENLQRRNENLKSEIDMLSEEMNQ